MEKIVLLKLNDKRKRYQDLPAPVRDEVSERIGSEFRKGTRDTIRGLDRLQEIAILPDMLGVSATDVNFTTKARDFWAEMTINPTVEGLKLNITTEKKTMTVDGEVKEVDMPLFPFDYMRWRFAVQSRRVAVTAEDMENLNSFEFYIIDLSAQKQKEVDEFAVKKAARLAYAKLSGDMQGKEEEINHVLQYLKEPGEYFDILMETQEKDMLLEAISNKKPKEFTDAVNDPYLAVKAKLKTAIALGFVTKEGNEFFLGSENMGPIKAALSFLTSKEKSGQVATLNARIEAERLNRKTV